MSFERKSFEPVAQRVIAFANARFYGENLALRPIQLSMLTALDEILRFKNELNTAGSPTFDPVSMYYGSRAGHSTLWRLVAAALDPEVVIVFPTINEVKLCQQDLGGPVPIPKHALSERQVFEEFNCENPVPKSLLDGPEIPLNVLPRLPTYPYSIVIFDYSGSWNYGKAPDWHKKMRNTLQGLGDRKVLTILS